MLEIKYEQELRLKRMEIELAHINDGDYIWRRT